MESMNVYPAYRDGRRPWVAQAVKIGGTYRVLAHVLVVAPDAATVKRGVKPLLAAKLRAKGERVGGRFAIDVRPASAHDLGMSRIGGAA